MKILWVSSTPTPEACDLFKIKATPFGGWIVSLSKLLIENQNIQLSIAFPTNNDSIEEKKGKNITYYSFKKIDKKDVTSSKVLKDIRYIIETAKPDILHIHGTEFPQSLAWITCFPKNNILLSIQGLISVCAIHYRASLPCNILNKVWISDLIFRRWSINSQVRNYTKRGILERKAIESVVNITGRTSLDGSYIEQVNPEANYYFCNETLRNIFYDGSWSINNCEKNSIFITQASNPLKGFHYMLDAMPLILKKHPDTKIYIAGGEIASTNTFKDLLKINSYGKYILSLINKYNIKNKITFTGVLNDSEMKKRYLRSHVFVCPSSIENSPNSLGEAMILGVPCVASYVGGIPDMLKHGEEGFLYHSEASYMLAHFICEIFSNDELANKFSENAKKRALVTHDPITNSNRMIEIYETLHRDSGS